MSVLNSLKVVANPAAQAKTTEQFRRNKLIAKLQEQLSLAEAQLGGTPYKRMRWVVVPNAEGEPVRVQRPVRLKQWWFKNASGQILLTIRYGAKPLAIAEGMTAIEVGNVENLPQTISTVIKAVDAGELDAELVAATKDRPFGKVKAEKKVSTKRLL